MHMEASSLHQKTARLAKVVWIPLAWIACAPGTPDQAPGTDTTTVAAAGPGRDNCEAQHSNTDKEATKLGYKLKRARHWKDLEDIYLGKWVGTIENDGATAPFLFDELDTPGKSACLRFLRYRYKDEADGGTVKDADAAFLYMKDGGPARKLSHALICLHISKHDNDVPPDVVEVPATCSRFRTTVRYGNQEATVERVNPDTQTAFPVDSLRSFIAQARLAAGIPPALARERLPLGPWYPCSPNGCCRGTN